MGEFAELKYKKRILIQVLCFALLFVGCAVIFAVFWSEKKPTFYADFDETILDYIQFDQELSVNRLEVRNSTFPVLISKATTLYRAPANSFIFFGYITRSHERTTHNWLCNTYPMRPKVHTRTLIVCSKAETCRNLSTLWKDVTFISLQQAIDMQESVEPPEIINPLSMRSQLVNALVHADIPLVLIGPDATWTKGNSFRYFQNYFKAKQDGAIFDMVCAQRGYPINGNFFSMDPMVINPTNRTRKFWAEVVRKLQEENPVQLYDQNIVERLLKDEFASVRWEVFIWQEVGDARWFDLKPREQKSLRRRMTVINHNYYTTIQNQITRQALHGQWFLRSNESCDLKQIRKMFVEFNGTRKRKPVVEGLIEPIDYFDN